MGKRLIVIDADDLIALLTFYTDGDVPLDTELITIGFSPYLERYVLLQTTSAQWKEAPINPKLGVVEPLIVRYEGKKTLSWNNNPGEEYEWKPISQK